MDGRDRIYNYSPYWLHYLDVRGVDGILKTFGDDLPMELPGVEGDGIQKCGDTKHFFWKPLLEYGEEKYLDMVVSIGGFRLFGLMEEHSDKYLPVVDLRKIGDGNFKMYEDGNFKMYAARDFEFGEAVLFLSEYEENARHTVLGGTHARVSKLEEESNVYLTTNRLLRCTKAIRKGEEVIRWDNGGSQLELLESIDQVVLAHDSTKLGKIGTGAVAGGTKKLVFFSDNTVEVFRRGHIPLVRGRFNLP